MINRVNIPEIGLVRYESENRYDKPTITEHICYIVISGVLAFCSFYFMNASISNKKI